MSTTALTGIHPDALELSELLAPTWPTITDRLQASGVPTNLTTDQKLGDRLKRIEGELSDLRDKRHEADRRLQSAKDTFAATETGTADQNDPGFKTVMEAKRELGVLEDRIASLNAEQIATLKLIGGSQAQHDAGAPPFSNGQAWGAADLLANDILRERLESMATSTFATGRTEIGQIIDRDALAASFGAQPMAATPVPGTTAMRRSDWAGIVPQLRRRLRIVDLLPAGTMDGLTLPYTQESGNFTSPAETTEGNLKPEAGVTYSDASADAATIAHWIKTRRQTLADAPALQTLLEGRLRYGVERRLEDAVLAGSGTAPAMRGILNTSGIGTVPFTTGALVADQILEGITNVFLADGEADAIVMNPVDWKNALKTKSSGDGQYYSGGPYAVTPQIMWGTPLIPSNAIAQGTSLVADFALGAQLFIRQGVSVLISDSDQDDFLRNQLTLLAEMRAALAVFRPAVFQSVALQ